MKLIRIFRLTDMCKVKGKRDSEKKEWNERKEWQDPASCSGADRFSLRSCIASLRILRFTHIYWSHCNSSYVNTKSHSSWGQGALVSGTGVLVGSDGNQLQDPFGSCPIHPLRSKINQDQVVVCSAWQEGGRWRALLYPIVKTGVQAKKDVT